LTIRKNGDKTTFDEGYYYGTGSIISDGDNTPSGYGRNNIIEV